MASWAPNTVRYPSRVTSGLSVRRAAGVVALTSAPVLVLGARPATAAPPEQWPEAEPASTLEVLLLLGAVPVALFLLITLLVYVPSMARGERYTPGRAWRAETVWFGGPKGGIEAADKVEPAALEPGRQQPADGAHEAQPASQDRGGASARW